MVTPDPRSRSLPGVVIHVTLETTALSAVGAMMNMAKRLHLVLQSQINRGKNSPL